MIKLEGTALRWGNWLDNLCVFSVPRCSLSWRVHLAEWTQYRQMNLSISIS